MKRRVQLEAVARDTLRYLPPDTKKRIRAALLALADDPLGLTSSIDVKRLARPTKDGPDILRARLGDWRIVYAPRERELLVLNVFHRSEGYGWLERL